MPEYHRCRLDNGMTVVLEKNTHLKTLSVGLWVKVGSAFESRSVNGISHFLEHMVFKGTEKRTALQIASALESVGGDLNAFTERENTCFHATVLNEHLPLALDVLSDLVLNPTFVKTEMERERKVLLQELSMSQEVPEDRIQDLLLESVWEDQPLGLPIIGTKKTLLSMTRGQLESFFRNHYRAANMVLAVAGNIGFQELVEECQKVFQFPKHQDSLALSPRQSTFHSHRRRVIFPTEQLHVLFGFEAPGVKAEGRWDALVMGYFLGGGMSSRLFQEIREKAGLAYSVDCDFLAFAETGLMNIYAALSERGFDKCLDILRRELSSLKENLISDADLELVKGQLRGLTLMSSDVMEVRQESIARNEILFGRYFSVEEVIQELEKVDAEKIRTLAKKMFVREKESCVVLGKKKREMRAVSIV